MTDNKGAPGRGPVQNGPSQTGNPSGGGRGNNPPRSTTPAPAEKSK
jgi:hypothetical protein